MCQNPATGVVHLGHSGGTDVDVQGDSEMGLDI